MYVCMSVCMYVCMCVCVYVCMCVCVYPLISHSFSDVYAVDTDISDMCIRRLSSLPLSYPTDGLTDGRTALAGTRK